MPSRAPFAAAVSFFDQDIDNLTEDQLTDYFSALRKSHSWTTVKLDLHGLRFYYQHVLQKPWVAPGLVKPQKVRYLPNIVTRSELQQIISATRVLSYRAFFLRSTAWDYGLVRIDPTPPTK